MPRKPKVEPIPATLSAAQFAGLFDVAHATLRDVFMRSGLVSVRGQYNTRDGIRTWDRHRRSQAESLDTEAAKDRTRRTKAEADNAELDTVKRRNFMRVIAREMFADGMAKLKIAIDTAKYLKPDQRLALHQDLMKIKLPEKEDEE